MSTLKVNAITDAAGANGNAITLATDGTCTAKITNRSSNIILNGSMQIAQRGTTAVAETGYKSVDRWQISYAGHDEALNQQQVDVSAGSSPYNLPVGSGHPYAHGFRKCFQIQNGNQTSGAGAGDFCQIVYRPEGQDINRSGWNYTDPNSKLTLSFWVKSSVAQNFYGFIEAGSPTRIFGFETGTLVAHTWKKVTAVIPGYASLVIPDTTAKAFSLAIVPFYGTNYTHASNRPVGTWYEAYNYFPDMASSWWTQNDATLQVTGVQLEAGSVATDFEHMSYAAELATCQRYYQRFTYATQTWVYCEGNGAQYKWIYADFSPMRASPTVGLGNLPTGSATAAGGSGTISSYTNAGQAGIVGSGGRISIRATWSAAWGTDYSLRHTDGLHDKYVSFTAEL